jgi:hypothetical protein
MDATIIYLKDGKYGKVEVVVEIIGKPNQSYVLSESILEGLVGIKVVDFVQNNEFTQEPPTEWMQ